MIPVRELIAEYTLEEENGNWFYLQRRSAGRVLLEFIEDIHQFAPGTLRIHLYPVCNASSPLFCQFGIDGKGTAFQRYGLKCIATGLGSSAPQLIIWRVRHVIDVLLTGLFHPTARASCAQFLLRFSASICGLACTALGLCRPQVVPNARYVLRHITENGGLVIPSESELEIDDRSETSDSDADLLQVHG